MMADRLSMTKDGGPSKLSAFGSAFVANGFTMYPVLLLLVIVGTLVAPRFLTTVNLVNILEQVSVLGLTTIGLTFVVLIGRLDLSLEGIVGHDEGEVTGRGKRGASRAPKKPIAER